MFVDEILKYNIYDQLSLAAVYSTICMNNFAKEQVSKEVLEVILDHYSPRLTYRKVNLFDISINYYFPQEDNGGNEYNTVAFSVQEGHWESCYLLACPVNQQNS
jgi:hypothetical protein